MQIEQILIIIGAGIFGILGTIHLVYTFNTNKFDARDENVTKAMQGTSPVLSRQTTMWKAWIGFNASHSLGAMLFSAFYIPLTISYFSVLSSSLWFTWLAPVTGVAYLFLAKKYWFNIAYIGISIATVCFFAAALLMSF